MSVFMRVPSLPSPLISPSFVHQVIVVSDRHTVPIPEIPDTPRSSFGNETVKVIVVTRVGT
jgi:hypothetical protein